MAHPLGANFGGDFPIVQDPDHTLLIMPAVAAQLLNLKRILNTFASATSFKVNYTKSYIVPINTEQAKMEELAGCFGCEIGKMPFTLSWTAPRNH